MYATSHRAKTPHKAGEKKQETVTTGTLMLVDSEPRSNERIQQLFERHHIACLFCTSLKQALEILQQPIPIDAMLIDLNLPNGDGIEVIRKAAKYRPDVPCVVLSEKNDVQSVVLAMKAGAIEYLTKPCPPSLLSSTILNAITTQKRLQPTINTGPRNQSRWPSQAMKQTMAEARDAAKADSPTLILGPPGSGKKSVAQWIHLKSARAKSCFVSVDASHIPSSRVEQELFGKSLSNHNNHKQSTRTPSGSSPKIEACMGGTLYIENIQCLSSRAQEELLEWLNKNQSAPNDQSCRLVASMPTDHNEVPQAKLRHDLWYAITVYQVTVPGLAQRSQDIPLLCEKLVSHLCATRHLRVPGITSKAMEMLSDHHWPGNIEELHNILEHAVTHTHDRLIGPSDLGYLNTPAPKRISRKKGGQVPDNTDNKNESTETNEPNQLTQTNQSSNPKAPEDTKGIQPNPESIEALTKATLIKTLELCQGNRRRTAKRLNVSLRTVYNMINRFGLPKKQTKPPKPKNT